MHTLPLMFTQNQWVYTQVERHGDHAIYTQTRKDQKSTRYEVIRVNHFEARPLPNGATMEAGEYYPGSTQWGARGWTHFTLREAQAHLQVLLAMKEDPDGAPPDRPDVP